MERLLVGPLIFEARESRGWSRTRMSGESGVDRSYLTKIEQGKTPGSLSAVVAMFTALGLDLNLLKPGEAPGRAAA